MSAAAPSAVEAKGALLLALRQAGVRDVNVLRAVETVPREIFVPYRLRDLAQRNCPLPIACGQTMEAPAALATALEALDLQPSHRVLEIGAGSGYSTAVLARLARETVSFERFNSLALEARARLDQMAVANARILCGDGLAAPEALGRFDRIVAHALFDAPPRSLLGALAPDGRLACALGQGAAGGSARRGELCAIDAAGGVVRRLAPSDLAPVLAGVAAVL